MIRAYDIMTPNPYCLKARDSVQKAASEFRKRQIDGAPVLDDNDKIIGIFTKTHIMMVVEKAIDINIKIGELMNRNVVTISMDTPIEKIWKTQVGRTPVTDREGKLIGIITRTDLVRVFSMQMEESINSLKVILESAYNAIIAVDKKGVITIWNQAAERLTGIPSEFANGKFAPNVLPNTGLLETLRSGKCSYGNKLQLNMIKAITNRTPMIQNGKVIGAVAVFQDISDFDKIASELKASQELNNELDAIIDSVYDGLYITDGDGYTTRINKSYTRITGIREEEVIGLHMQELVDMGYYSQSVTLIVLEKKQPVTILHTIKGALRALITGNPIFDDEGNITKVVTTVRDMTELINLKEKLEKTEALTQRYHLELEHLRKQQISKSEVIGQSEEIARVLRIVEQTSRVDAIVLITGETGVGKEVIALQIHKNSDRNKGPFIKVNCAAIPESLLESELFGYEKGAFTGAQNKGKPGMFELADTGTILLDEIGDFPLNLQAKLLRVLQEKEVTRIGGTQSQKLNIRIIAATNQDLAQLVAEGKFRGDLYYRLNVIPINISPLRMRKDDIPLLVKHFLDIFNEKYGRNKRFSMSALETLSYYSWPGNVRELKNLIERLVVMVPEDLIDTNHLNGILSVDDFENRTQLNLKGATLPEVVANIEKQMLQKVIEEKKSTRKAAKELGVSQPTIIRKARKYGITLRNDS